MDRLEVRDFMPGGRLRFDIPDRRSEVRDNANDFGVEHRIPDRPQEVRDIVNRLRVEHRITDLGGITKNRNAHRPEENPAAAEWVCAPSKSYRRFLGVTRYNRTLLY